MKLEELAFENRKTLANLNRIDLLDIIEFLQEHRKLKKQLEDKEEELELVRCDLHNRTSERDGSERELDECLSQQKEFIKFLEGELLHARYYARDIAHYIEYVLRKYKEIIQTKNNNSV